MKIGWLSTYFIEVIDLFGIILSSILWLILALGCVLLGMVMFPFWCIYKIYKLFFGAK